MKTKGKLTLKEKSLRTAMTIIRMRQEYYPETFGRLKVKRIKDCIEIIEPGVSALKCEHVHEIISAIPTLSWYIRYCNGAMTYHIY